MSLESYMLRGAAASLVGGLVVGAYKEGEARKEYRHSGSIDRLFFHRFVIAAGVFSSPFVGLILGASIYESKHAYLEMKPGARKGALVILAAAVAAIVAGHLGNKE